MVAGSLACAGLYEENPLWDGSGGSGDGDGESSGDGDGDGDTIPLPAGMAGNDALWIDAVEVSVGAYELFLDAAPASPPDSPLCAGKSDYTPALWAEQSSNKPKPVVGVDWCDAYAYCAWAGKRLCAGKPDNPFDEVSLDNEWFRACATSSFNSYPYGGDYDPGACNGEDKQFGALLDVGALASCEGGFEGLFDMSGNVWEWTGACAEEQGETQCLRRGGSYFSSASLLDCAASGQEPVLARKEWIGIRCCADPGSL